MASPEDLEAGGLPIPPAPGATIDEAIEKDDKKPVKGGAKKDQLADVKAVVLGAMATKAMAGLGGRAAAARHLGRVAARAQLFAICMQLCCESFVSDPSCFEGEVPFCLLG